jgi:hypothetical protein
MHRADEFVFLDDVQFDKHGWRNRNRIKGPGGPQWLTVPVRIHGLSQPPICDVEIEPTQRRWAVKHLQALRTNYAPCPFFEWLYPDLEAALQQPWTHIADLDIALVKLLCGKLGLQRRTHRSSSLGAPHPTESGTEAQHNGGSDGRCERLIELCHALNCDHYYSGAAARDYLDFAAFERAGITVEFQDYAYPTYPQRYGAFTSHLSIVDLLFNCGPQSLAILTGQPGMQHEECGTENGPPSAKRHASFRALHSALAGGEAAEV